MQKIIEAQFVIKILLVWGYFLFLLWNPKRVMWTGNCPLAQGWVVNGGNFNLGCTIPLTYLKIVVEVFKHSNFQTVLKSSNAAKRKHSGRLMILKTNRLILLLFPSACFQSIKPWGGASLRGPRPQLTHNKQIIMEETFRDITFLWQQRAPSHDPSLMEVRYVANGRYLGDISEPRHSARTSNSPAPPQRGHVAPWEFRGIQLKEHH